MARRYRRTGSFRGRKYSYGFSRRGFGGNVGGMGLNLSPAFLLGAVVGYSNYDDKIPAEATLLGASLPIKAKGFGVIKGAAQGILFGNVIQSAIANKGMSGKTSNFGI